MFRFFTDISEQILYLGDEEFTAEDCKRGLQCSTDDRSVSLALFLERWFDASPTIEVKTSGSTGTPKVLKVEKKHMIQSAVATCTYFDLQRGDRVLLPLPLEYISGMMMVVRALVAGLELYIVPLSSHPMSSVSDGQDFRFIPMTPMQLSCTLEVDQERSRLDNVEIILLGGGVVPVKLERDVETLKSAVYSSYGMTETLSHIALRRVNGSDRSDYYTPLEGVHLSLSEDDTLVINAPKISSQVLVTNDIADLSLDGTFTIEGRKDNVVNSGGVKIHLEKVEEMIRRVLPLPFALTSIPDDILGERLVMLIEKHSDIDLPMIKEEIKGVLPSIQTPKEIYLITSIPMTETDKINRKACKEIAYSKSK